MFHLDDGFENILDSGSSAKLTPDIGFCERVQFVRSLWAALTKTRLLEMSIDWMRRLCYADSQFRFCRRDESIKERQFIFFIYHQKNVSHHDSALHEKQKKKNYIPLSWNLFVDPKLDMIVERSLKLPNPFFHNLLMQLGPLLS